MNEESLVELREFPLDKTSADHVNNPELDFFAGNVEAAGDHVVGKFAVRGRGGQGGEGQEADFAEGGRVVDSCNPFTKIRCRKKRERVRENKPLSSTQPSCSSLNSS